MTNATERDLAVVVTGQPSLARDIVEQVVDRAGMHTIDLTRDALEPVDVVVLVDPVAADWDVVDRTTVPCVLVSSEPLVGRDLVDAVRRGADAVLDVSAGLETLLSTIEAVAKTGSALSPTQARELIELLRARVLQGDEEAPRLSPREREVLRSMARGESTQAIARTLDLSSKTVKNVESRLRLKLGVGTRGDVVTRAEALGLLADY